MIYNTYNQRMYEKLEKALNGYAKHIFKPIAKIENALSLETTEHLRKVPKDEDMKTIAPGTQWGSEYGNLWLKTEIVVPAEADGKVLCAIPDVSAVEILCFANGKPAGIINSKNCFIGGEHSAMFVSPCAKAGEKIELGFECYAGHYDFNNPGVFVMYDDTCEKNYTRTYGGITIAVVEECIRDCVFDLSTVLKRAKVSGESRTHVKAFDCLRKAFSLIIQDVNYASYEELCESAVKIIEALAPALEKSAPDRARGKVGVVGHSHMDTAWLWPVSETIRKCARTYSQALTLMKMYPEYTFIQSSALHLDWMREYYPDIFEEIKQRAHEGRYDYNGGVWVECDCNITGGESMIRQFLYGQRFSKEHLGYYSDCFWLPDTFGYNAAIPQIMQGCNVKYFYTTKLDWNDLNGAFPATTFRWRGMGDAEVITHLNRIHFIPEPEEMIRSVCGIRENCSADVRLASYGFGDGGGGPTYGALEYLRRTKDLSGMPVIEPTTASKFMQEIEEEFDNLPVYEGELYLESHRGTLTKMHRIKKLNRNAEQALYKMELLNVVSGKRRNEKQDEYYKILLKNQFHDILPGTCIPKVYEIAFPEMEKLISDANGETDKYLSAMSDNKADKISLYNPLGFDRNDIAVLDGEVAFDGTATQTYVDSCGNTKTALSVNIPAMSSVTLKFGESKTQGGVFREDGNTLTTPFYRVQFDENGYISSLVDIEADREIRNMKGKSLGTLIAGEDYPSIYDNWNIDDDIELKLNPVYDLVSREVVSVGDVEYRVRSSYKVGRSSTVTIDTVFYADNRRIDFEVRADWNERHTLLKADFDVNIKSAFVKNEMQFGHIDRPTTRNNGYEAAKFEICNHKWSDMSETHYGVAILNDCKYGMSALGSDMRLTLFKGGTRPDNVSDFGTHTMVYSLLPHKGGFDAETVVKPAYELNYSVVRAEGELNVPKLFTLSNSGIVCESVKVAEDVENAYVIRLYESERNESKCEVAFGEDVKVYSTDMLEESAEELAVTDNKVSLKFKPFEIKTLLVKRI